MTSPNDQSEKSFNAGNGYCPRLTISDDYHNLWQFAGSQLMPMSAFRSAKLRNEPRDRTY